jgi:FkbM family methyltransferase
MIKRILKKLLYKYKNTSYAQAGEDMVIRYLFRDIGKKFKINYLDLGTNIPDFGNNTYWFYRKKGKGVCVEADPTLVGRIKKVRPKDKVINAGVAVSEEKEADFFVFDEPAISTFNKQEAELRSSTGRNKIVKVAKVPLVDINKLIKQNFQSYPDLISIDIEGLDLDVLKSLDYARFPVPVICVETCTYSENHIRPKDPSIAEFMKTVGYEVYADTYINTIFVNKSWFYKQ